MFISHFLLVLKAFGVLKVPFFQSLTSPNGRPSHPAVSVFERNPGPSGAWEYRRWREKEFGQTMFVRLTDRIICPKRADFEQKNEYRSKVMVFSARTTHRAAQTLRRARSRDQEEFRSSELWLQFRMPMQLPHSTRLDPNQGRGDVLGCRKISRIDDADLVTLGRLGWRHRFQFEGVLIREATARPPISSLSWATVLVGTVPGKI
jgi:hypothetical protein